MSREILFIGEGWLGSCARSLREALARRSDLVVDDLNENAWFPRFRSPVLRVIARVSNPLQTREFEAQVLERVRDARPFCVMTYKGHPVRRELLERIRDLGVPTVNVYPDCSPHAHGDAHRRAVAAYDLVVSTKAYHPGAWKSVYGFDNRCLFVPQGYDPALHLVDEPPERFAFDVVMVATYRPEYGRFVSRMAELLRDRNLRVAIGGYGWEAVKADLPSSWTFPGGVQGRRYISLLRSGKICVAPLTREMSVRGERQPGDVDTTRTYELAAAHCFFLHRRTDFAQTLYTPDEVPMFDDGDELTELVLRYVQDDEGRRRAAAAAHRRAVPAYSLDARAAELSAILMREFS